MRWSLGVVTNKPIVIERINRDRRSLFRPEAANISQARRGQITLLHRDSHDAGVDDCPTLGWKASLRSVNACAHVRPGKNDRGKNLVAPRVTIQFSDKLRVRSEAVLL